MSFCLVFGTNVTYRWSFRFPSTPQANGATRWLKHRERQLNDTTSPQPIMKPLPTRSTRSQRVMPTYSYRGSDTSSLFSDSIAPSGKHASSIV